MICNTRLSLSLGSGKSTNPPTNPDSIQQHNTISHDNCSLTLALSSSSDCNNNMNHVAVSSVSNTSVKRERESTSLEDEEVELENMDKLVSTKVIDDDDDDQEFGTRKKLRLRKEQSAVLEDSFKEHTTLNSKQKQELARRLSLRPRQVEVWFQNRRARTKLKQTEVDCEVLRKSYEELKDENRRLQKEVQELNSLKMAAAPFRVQLSAATLSMCPSCERSYATSSDNSTTKISFSIGDQKPHFYGPFTNSSAAC